MTRDLDRQLAGRYRLTRRLERERGSVLWEAWDEQQMQPVHIRLLDEHLRDQPLVVMRFCREETLAKRLDHPNLRGPRELIEQQEALGLVYEVPGEETLADRLDEKGPVGPEELALLFEPLIDGLEHAHRRGMIHRNLGLRKLWLCDEAGIRLTGFGGAKVLDMVGLTTHSVAFGVSHYRAPEQLRGDNARVGRHTDVWAVGVMLFEALVGQPPVDAAGPQAMLAAYRNLEVTERLGDAADTPVGRVVQQALCVDIDERARSMAELHRLLVDGQRSAGTAETMEVDGPDCWRCGHPRIRGFVRCFECGADPLIDPDGKGDDGEGDVQVLVPKFRREDPTRYRGFHSWRDILLRRFIPRLDAERRAVICDRLEQAGAELAREGRERMMTSPFLITGELSRRQAYRLGEFLRTGEPVDDADAVELTNPSRFEQHEIPVLYRLCVSWMSDVDDELLYYPHWLWAGVTWTSPAVKLAGVLAVAGGLVFAIVTPSGMVSGLILAILFFWFVARFSFVPVGGDLSKRYEENQKPIARWPGQWNVESTAIDRRLVADITRGDDRQLVRTLLARARRLLQQRDDIDEPERQLEELFDRIRPEVRVLAEAPGEEEWKRLQHHFESLQVRQHRDPEAALEGRAAELADQIRHHEQREVRCELARTRLSYLLEQLGEDADGDDDETSREHDDAGAVDVGVELTALGGSIDTEVQQLRAEHEALLELQGVSMPDVSVSPAAKQVKLGVELPSRFEPIRRLGDGGLASVVLVDDLQRGEPVALKLAHPQLSGEPGVSALFRREYEAASAVPHPRVVSIHEHLRVDGRDALVMEHLPGIDLASMVRWRGPLPVGEVSRIADQLLEALAAAHRRGVIHGDVKPANVIVDEHGDITLIDFGLARMEAIAASQTLESRLGTPGYCAPEVLEERLVDERADIYGVGVTLLEALIGEVPFDSDGQIEGSPDRWKDIGDRQLAEILRSATAPHRGDRFRTAEQMRAALRGEGDVDMGGEQAGARVVELPSRCHRCGRERIEGIGRCFRCGARRRHLRLASRWRGKQVVVSGILSERPPESFARRAWSFLMRLLALARRERDDRVFLDAEELEDVRGAIEEYPNAEPVENFEHRIAAFPVMFCPPVDDESAQALCASLRRRGLDATAKFAVGPAWLSVVRRSLPNAFASNVVLAARLWLIVLLMVTGLGVVAFLAGVQLWLEGASAVVESARVLMPHIPVALVGTLFALSVLAVGPVVAGLVRSSTRVATRIDRPDDGDNNAEPPWGERAYQLWQQSDSERVRGLLWRLVECAAAVRRAFKRDQLRDHLVERLDELIDSALSELEELIEAERLVIDDPPWQLAERIERLDQEESDSKAKRRERERTRKELSERLDRAERARRRVVEIGTRLVRVTDQLGEITGDLSDDGADEELEVTIDDLIGEFDEVAARFEMVEETG